jgi:hypothetical protein
MTARSTPPTVAAAVIATGVCALALRPPASLLAPAIAAAVGAAGLLAPLAPRAATGPAGSGAARSGTVRSAAALALGAAAFAAARALGPSVPVPFWWPAALAAAAAGIAEEAFFRRFVYGELLRWGPSAAVTGAAVLFALVHWPAYGPAALPVDFAAGLLFGWQRWATGRWSVPAATHVLANLLQMR